MRLMSRWATAMVAANNAVNAPTNATTVSAVEFAEDPKAASAWKSGYIRATRKTPAATIVAAWISALTGVGPSIASGNHTCKGNWPDFPTAPQKMQSEITVDPAMPQQSVVVAILVRAVAS